MIGNFSVRVEICQKNKHNSSDGAGGIGFDEGSGATDGTTMGWQAVDLHASGGASKLLELSDKSQKKVNSQKWKKRENNEEIMQE